jgi:hypothetical protein
MSEGAKISILLCMGLEPAEQRKVERLDGPIADVFIQAGVVARLCQGRTQGGERFLAFTGPTGTVASVRAGDFMAASDRDAVEVVSRAVFS